MRVAALVVEERPLACRVLDVGSRRAATSSARAVSAASSRIESAVRASPPARRAISASGRGASSTPSAAAPRRDDLDELLLGERLELVDLHAREERGVELEVRVLGRRADQRQEALLDAGQQRVLLGLVEAVDLVEEEDRPPCPFAPSRSRARASTSRTFATVAETAESSSNSEPVRRRDDARERRLAGAGRAVEDSEGTRSPSIASRSARTRPDDVLPGRRTRRASRGRSRCASGARLLEPARPRPRRRDRPLRKYAPDDG